MSNSCVALKTRFVLSKPTLSETTKTKSIEARPFEFLWPDLENNVVVLETILMEDLHELPIHDLNTFYLGVEVFEEILQRFKDFMSASSLPVYTRLLFLGF